jgi:PAS domain S-box-containing protein
VSHIKPQPIGRAARTAFAVFAAFILAFAVWCGLLMVSTGGLRRDLEARIGWLQELDALGLAADETTLAAEVVEGHRALHGQILAAAPGPTLQTALVALDAALAEGGPAALALARDGLRKELRRDNATISGQLGDAWRGLNLAAFAALLLAGGSLVLAWFAMVRGREARRLGQRLVQNEARIRTVVELAADGIVTVDESGVIVGVNRAAADLFGLAAAELLGRPLVDLVPGIGRSLREPPGAPTRLEARRRKDAPLPIGVSVARLDQDQASGAVVVMRDVTLDVRTEQAMAAARDAALRAAEFKSDFVASMSHELRTPLNAIIGYGEMLREQMEEEGKAEWVGDVDRLLLSSRHLVALIGDILDISKIEAGRVDMSLASFDVAEIMTEVAASAEPLAAAQNNRFSLELAPGLRSIVTDRTRIRQILLNLLSNAAKFTKDGSIRLTVRRELREGDPWLVFTVEDTGVGISEQALRRLFRAFERGDPETRRSHAGTGLGLAISQRLSALMGGSITVTSEVGRGSTFTVALPATPRARAKPSA